MILEKIEKRKIIQEDSFNMQLVKLLHNAFKEIENNEDHIVFNGHESIDEIMHKLNTIN